jgi:hypothetical protein
MKFTIDNLYLISIYSLGVILIWYGKESLPLFVFLAYILFINNQLLMRIADEESMIIVICLAAAAEVMLLPFNEYAFFGLIFIANPLVGINKAGNFLKPQVFAPYDVEKILIPLRVFLGLPKNSKVLFAFSDPKGSYEKIFDGYRFIIEAPLLVAAEKEIHLFPDWYAVTETNFDGAPSIWGKSFNEVLRNVHYWKIEYVLIYQDSGTSLELRWLSKFHIYSEFDWADVLSEDEMSNLFPKTLKTPKWWILKLKNNEF